MAWGIAAAGSHLFPNWEGFKAAVASIWGNTGGALYNGFVSNGEKVGAGYGTTVYNSTGADLGLARNQREQLANQLADPNAQTAATEMTVGQNQAANARITGNFVAARTEDVKAVTEGLVAGAEIAVDTYMIIDGGIALKRAAGTAAAKRTGTMEAEAASGRVAVGEVASDAAANIGKTATASAPGARVTIGGVQATELSGRLSPAEMAAQQQHGTEFAQIYLTGPGPNGGGGTYYLIQGAPGRVQVPVAPNVRWINHTHPETLTGYTVPLEASPADKNVLRLLERAGSPQRTSQIVPEVGQPFTFQR